MTSSWPSPRGDVAGLDANQHRDEGVVVSNTLGLRGDIALKTTDLGEKTFILADHENEIRGNILSKPRIIKLS